MKTLKEKEITLLGQTYRFKKFTPEIACYWAMQIFGSVLGGVLGNGKLSVKMAGQIIKEFVKMPRADHKDLQRDCLSFVYTVMPTGVFPLLNSEGNFTLADISAPVVLVLVITSLEFSLRDFFDQSLLTDLVGAIPALSSLVETNGSESSFSPQSDLNTGSTTTSGMENIP